jgi:murein DD-endopeptidase / murein LD-carboxypeptidase
MDGSEKIAHRAGVLVGTKFRLHGRSTKYGLDCVGLVTACVESVSGAKFGVPNGYSLRGNYQSEATRWFDTNNFREVENGHLLDGDIVLVQVGSEREHFQIIAHGGAVHAHAGLAYVVWTPLPLTWPIITHWRWRN